MNIGLPQKVFCLEEDDRSSIMVNDINNLVGICGIYCGTCPHYLAYRKNDTVQLEKMSQEKSAPIENLRCDGCL